MSGRRAVFFDRDGTLMEEVHYCADPAKVRMYADVPEALDRLRAAGFLIVIISNQAGIGRGLFTEAQYHAVQAELLRQIGSGRIDAAYFCSDAPGVPSTRRKPAPGMVLEASVDLGIDLGRSFFVGDKSVDVECGRRAGVRTVQVSTGYGAEQEGGADHRADGVEEAVEWVLSQ